MAAKMHKIRKMKNQKHTTPGQLDSTISKFPSFILNLFASSAPFRG